MQADNTDINGKPYATVAGIKAGDTVIVDAGFTCIKPNTHKFVYIDPDGLYITCGNGKRRHGLDGQLSDDGTAYVGLYKVLAERLTEKASR